MIRPVNTLAIIPKASKELVQRQTSAYEVYPNKIHAANP